MTRTEPKPPRKLPSRIWIGLAVLAAVAIVLGLKFQSPGDDQPSATVVVSGVAHETPIEAPPSVAAPLPTKTLLASPTAATALPTKDTFPTDPVGQIAWVQRNNKPAMILFHSTSCIPCKRMEELVAKIRDDYEPDVYFVDVITNDKANSALVRQAGIQAIPTTFFFSSEGKGKRAVGAITEDALREQLNLLREGGL